MLSQSTWTFTSLFSVIFFACRTLLSASLSNLVLCILIWVLTLMLSQLILSLSVSFSMALLFISSPQDVSHQGKVTFLRACLLHLTVFFGESKGPIWNSFLHWQGQVQCLGYRKYWISVWSMSWSNSFFLTSFLETCLALSICKLNSEEFH